MKPPGVLEQRALAPHLPFGPRLLSHSSMSEKGREVVFTINEPLVK